MAKQLLFISNTLSRKSVMITFMFKAAISFWGVSSDAALCELLITAK